MSKIYVACLASYNNGILHGEWIEATSDAGAMRKQVDAMLKASPSPDAEEFAIHDTDGIDLASEYVGLQAVADKIALIEEFENEFGDDAAEVIEAFEGCFGIGQATDAGRVRDAYCGQYESALDYAYEFVNSTGMLHDVPESLRMYFNYEAFARDLFIKNVSMGIDGHVFHSNW